MSYVLNTPADQEAIAEQLEYCCQSPAPGPVDAADCERLVQLLPRLRGNALKSVGAFLAHGIRVSVVASNRDSFRACYDKSLKSHPDIKGTFILSFVLNPDGTVKSFPSGATAFDVANSISPRLADRLSSFVTGRNPNEPLFLSPEGMRLHPENLVKRKLKPLLKQLGLQGGLHAFRHGNATAQDRLHTPMKVRQERLGHVSSRTTMDYTHLVGDDDRRVVEQLDELFCPIESNQTEGRIM